MRVSGGICFTNMDLAVAGIDALREVGFEAEIDYDNIEIDTSMVFGAVWYDIPEGIRSCHHISDLMDEILSAIAPFGGYCPEFGRGCEGDVWRDFEPKHYN